MKANGKHLQIGAGSRSRSQAKAEDAARRSRKRADEREAERLEAEEIRHGYIYGHYSDAHIHKYGGPS